MGTPTEAGITLTAKAAAEIQRVIDAHAADLSDPAVRIGVQGKGLQQHYVFDLTEQIGANDRVFESQGLRLVCTADDAPRVAGTQIDFRDGPDGGGFVFHAPPERRSARREEETTAGPPPDEDQVRDALRQVIDPEVGLNIVDLGLVYGIEIDGRAVHVRLTMTTPACPLSETIMADAERRVLAACPGTAAIDLELVWKPPWTSEMMSDRAKEAMGWRR